MTPSPVMSTTSSIVAIVALDDQVGRVRHEVGRLKGERETQRLGGGDLEDALLRHGPLQCDCAIGGLDADAGDLERRTAGLRTADPKMASPGMTSPNSTGATETDGRKAENFCSGGAYAKTRAREGRVRRCIGLRTWVQRK